jgi:hypothetical protein
MRCETSLSYKKNLSNFLPLQSIHLKAPTKSTSDIQQTSPFTKLNLSTESSGEKVKSFRSNSVDQISIHKTQNIFFISIPKQILKTCSLDVTKNAQSLPRRTTKEFFLFRNRATEGKSHGKKSEWKFFGSVYFVDRTHSAVNVTLMSYIIFLASSDNFARW